MADPHYHSTKRFTNVVQFSFFREDKSFTVTISLDESERLMADLANILRDADQLPSVEPNDIGLAIRGELDTETRVVRSVSDVQVVPPEDTTQPTILRVAAGTATGPMDLRITQIASQELMAILNKHPLTRGSA